MPSGRSASISAAVVVAVAIAARLLVFAEIKDGPVPHMRVWTQSDMSFFDAWARAVAAGDVLTATDMRPYHRRHHELACSAAALAGDPNRCDEASVRATWDAWVGRATFWQDPGYPYALAVLYALFGHGIFVGYALNVALGLLVVVCVHRIGLALGGPAAGLAGGLIAALYGPLLFYETLLLRETAIAGVGLVLVVAVLRALEVQRALRWAVCGVCAGAFVLLKASGLIFVVTIPAIAIAAARARGVDAGLRTGLCCAGAFMLGLSLSLAPLVARNVAVGIAPLSVASTGALNFLNGNAVDRSVGAGSAVSELAAPILVRTGGDALAVVRATIASHPSLGSWLRLLAGKAAAFWRPREIPNNASYEYFALQAPLFSRLALGFTVLCALALPGVFAASRKRVELAVLLAYIAAGIAVCVVFFNLSRFRLPVACAMMPLAGCGAAAMLAALRARRWATVAAAGLASGAVVAAGTIAGGVAGSDGIRIADYGVANEISVHLARRALGEAREEDAVALVGRQLQTEPAELAAIRLDDRAARVTRRLSGIAGTFVELHRIGADAAEAVARPVDAQEHRRRAFLYERINAPYASR